MNNNDKTQNKSSKTTIKMGNLYEFNKQACAEMPSLTFNQIQKVKSELQEWFNWQIDGYAILLCRERYDFTVFHLYEKENKNPPEVATNELIELLKERGKILSIEKDAINKSTWEIWIKIDNEAFAYYLFNCDDWVIEC